jgi:hypothetical protein
VIILYGWSIPVLILEPSPCSRATDTVLWLFSYDLIGGGWQFACEWACMPFLWPLSLPLLQPGAVGVLGWCSACRAVLSLVFP